MDACGREFARLFASVGATKVLTAEISGIAPAVTTAIHLGLPVVYARKHKPITMPDQVYLTLAPSHTKGRMVELIVSPEYMANNEKILIIDDFLASGATILGLVRLAESQVTLPDQVHERGVDAVVGDGPVEELDGPPEFPDPPQGLGDEDVGLVLGRPGGIGEGHEDPGGLGWTWRQPLAVGATILGMWALWRGARR